MGVLEILKQGMSVYCERGVGLLFTQPANTISNIAIFISAYLAYQFVQTHHIKSLIIRMLPLIVALAGVGSVLWHGMPSLLTSFADLLPLSAFILVSFFFLLGKLLPNKRLVCGIFCLFILIETPFIFGILPSFNGFIQYFLVFIFGIFVFVGVAKKYHLFPQLIPIIIVFAMALFSRTIDLKICSMFSAGTHFVWHILIGFLLYLIIRFLVEIEKRK